MKKKNEVRAATTLMVAEGGFDWGVVFEVMEYVLQKVTPSVF